MPGRANKVKKIAKSARETANEALAAAQQTNCILRIAPRP